MRIELAILLCLGARFPVDAQSFPDYCAVEVHVRNSSGTPVKAPVMVDPDDAQKMVAESIDGTARFCDVGFKEFKVIVGEPCGRVTVSGLRASPPATRVVNVVYDECWSGEPPPGGNACMVLLRVAAEGGALLDGATLQAPGRVNRQSDHYGRIFVMIRYGNALRGTVTHAGYRAQDIYVTCREDTTNFESRVDLSPLRP